MRLNRKIYNNYILKDHIWLLLSNLSKSNELSFCRRIAKVNILHENSSKQEGKSKLSM